MSDASKAHQRQRILESFNELHEQASAEAKRRRAEEEQDPDFQALYQDFEYKKLEAAAQVVVDRYAKLTARWKGKLREDLPPNEQAEADRIHVERNTELSNIRQKLALLMRDYGLPKQLPTERIDTPAKLAKWIDNELTTLDMIGRANGDFPADEAWDKSRQARDFVDEMRQANGDMPALRAAASDPRDELRSIRGWCIDAQTVFDPAQLRHKLDFIATRMEKKAETLTAVGSTASIEGDFARQVRTALRSFPGADDELRELLDSQASGSVFFMRLREWVVRNIGPVTGTATVMSAAVATLRVLAANDTKARARRVQPDNGQQKAAMRGQVGSGQLQRTSDGTVGDRGVLMEAAGNLSRLSASIDELHEAGQDALDPSLGPIREGVISAAVAVGGSVATLCDALHMQGMLTGERKSDLADLSVALTFIGTVLRHSFAKGYGYRITTESAPTEVVDEWDQHWHTIRHVAKKLNHWADVMADSAPLAEHRQRYGNRQQNTTKRGKKGREKWRDAMGKLLELLDAGKLTKGLTIEQAGRLVGHKETTARTGILRSARLRGHWGLLSVEEGDNAGQTPVANANLLDELSGTLARQFRKWDQQTQVMQDEEEKKARLENWEAVQKEWKTGSQEKAIELLKMMVEFPDQGSCGVASVGQDGIEPTSDGEIIRNRAKSKPVEEWDQDD